MRTQQLNPAILAIMCEQIGASLYGEYTVDHYISPILKWMTEEWARIRKLIADMIVDVAMGKPILLEAQADVWFPVGRQNLIWQSSRKLLGDMQKELKGKVAGAKQQARIDANPPGLVDWSDTMPVTLRLSREGLEEVIGALDYQVGFMDDFTKSTRDRVLGLTRARYGTFTELRNEVSRTFRIDRDKTMGLFKSDVQGLAQRVIDGTLDVDGFVRQMEGSIGNYYERLYKQGKNVTTLQDWERELIRQQVQGQKQYLDNFGDYIRNKQALGQELTGRVTWRAGLYAERGSAMFEFGVMNAWPDDILIDWKMQPAEHCTTCPIYEGNSPYTKDTLPGFPGEGFNLSECGVNCNCIIQPSDLYVWKPVEVEPEPEIVPAAPTAEDVRQKIVNMGEANSKTIADLEEKLNISNKEFVQVMRQYEQSPTKEAGLQLLEKRDQIKARSLELSRQLREAKELAQEQERGLELLLGMASRQRLISL